MKTGTKLLVGVDESGYGPNLGPLVVVAAGIEVPSDITSQSLWKHFEPVITRFPRPRPDSLVVDDSKRVYAGGTGFEQLEHTVLTWLSLSGPRPESLRALWSAHCLTPTEDMEECPCFAGQDLMLPHKLSAPLLDSMVPSVQQSMTTIGANPVRVVCQIVLPHRFNKMLNLYESKGLALFQTNAELLRSLWNRTEAKRVEVILDKHGGRHFYQPLLQQEFHETIVLRGREGANRSEYSITTGGRSLQAIFLPKADSQHFLVALASMIAKYLRELYMVLFNSFWATRINGLRPTAGYPDDARRFWHEIEPLARSMGMPVERLWRAR